MRLAVWLVALILLSPLEGSANAILHLSSDESRITYGTDTAFHSGLPHFGFTLLVDGTSIPTDWTMNLSEFAATSGPLLQHTLQTDGSGAVTHSTYVYDGGTFEMTLRLWNSVSGESLEGAFLAPIIGPYELVVTERENSPQEGDSVDAFYRLGAGVFDPWIAEALGIAAHSKGGTVDAPYLTFGTGDHTSLEREAGEGAPTVTIDVPEPSSVLLLAIAGVGLLIRRRARGA